MDINEVRELAALMREMGLTMLDYAAGGASVHLERPADVPAALSAEDTQPALPESSGAVFTVTSPMVGVFYASASPESKPYVSIGDRVNAGDVLCIIEAMKMMNEITAEKSGVITEICVGNKQIVEYGHPMFRMRLE